MAWVQPSACLGAPVERAELARRDADVGVVDVAVDEVGDDAVRVAAAAHRVGRLAERVQRGVGVEQERLLRADPPAVGGPVEDGLKVGHGFEGNESPSVTAQRSRTVTPPEAMPSCSSSATACRSAGMSKTIVPLTDRPGFTSSQIVWSRK